MKVIVCGGREYRLTDDDISWLNRLHEKRPFTLVIEGGCRRKDYRGNMLPTADYGAYLWARSRGIQTATMDANFSYYGKSGGPRRNAAMARLADVCLAFPGGRGTESMIEQAALAGLPVKKPGDE